MVWGLVLSPGVGAGVAVMLRRQPADVLRAAVLANLLCTAVLGTALAAMASASTPQARVVAGWTTWTVPRSTLDRSDNVPKRESPWLEVVVSLGRDHWNAAALLWIPWLALSALLVVDAPVERPALFYGLFCAWEACLLGCFAAYDALTFLSFDAAALWLGCALTGGWGQAHRRAAAGKFWRHQFAGQCAWFVGLAGLGVVAAWCHFYVSPRLPALSWTWPTLTEQLSRVVRSSWEIAAYFESASAVLLVVLAFGALLRSPVVPLHSWWPVLATEAPSPVAVLTASAWCPLGMYAWLRFVAPVFSDSIALHAGQLAFAGEVTAVLAGLLALAQTDLRRYAAYAALCLQGVAWTCASASTETGNAAALSLSQAAGLGAAAWLLSIALLERRYHTRELDAFGGLAMRLPRFAVALAAMLVCVNGFPAPFRAGIDLSVGWTLAEHRPWGLVAAVAGWLAVGWGGVWALQRLLFGPVREPTSQDSLFGDASGIVPLRPREVQDLSWTECAAFAPLVGWCLWFGMPGQFVDQVEESSAAVVRLRETTSQGRHAP